MISVLIPTHNPDPKLLNRTLQCLRGQTLSLDQWECLLIDNASSKRVDPHCLSWHPRGRVVREDNLGLTNARIRGVAEAQYNLLIWSDDDNLLESDYLDESLLAFADNPKLGAAGGKSLPEYLEHPPDWFELGLAPLGCRDLGEHAKVAKWNPEKPDYHSSSDGR